MPQDGGSAVKRGVQRETDQGAATCVHVSLARQAARQVCGTAGARPEGPRPEVLTLSSPARPSALQSSITESKSPCCLTYSRRCGDTLPALNGSSSG